jgi:hypothetical protein
VRAYASKLLYRCLVADSFPLAAETDATGVIASPLFPPTIGKAVAGEHRLVELPIIQLSRSQCSAGQNLLDVARVQPIDWASCRC